MLNIIKTYHTVTYNDCSTHLYIYAWKTLSDIDNLCTTRFLYLELMYDPTKYS